MPTFKRHYPAHDATNFGIKEWRHQLLDQSRTGNVVGIEDQDDFGVHQFHGILQRRGFAAFSRGAMERLNAPGEPLYKVVYDLARPVGRTVIHRNHQHSVFGIFDRHQGAENVGDDLLLVVSGHEHGHGRPVGCVNVDVRMSLETEKSVQREPVVAGGVDADHENDEVENINHGAQPRREHRLRVVTPYLRRRLCLLFPRGRSSGDGESAWALA